ncbi:gelsolin-like [Brachionichthys hirsutus]|uniref:gelsolin-like n=1 Tax=Brachionichthys hirsutus TaxID=412623 RepID=UPI003604D1E0
MVYHPEFENMGQKDGVEAWRVENMELVPVPGRLCGEFYSGDAYLVLRTIETCGRKQYNLHFWLGADCSQDERAAAVIFAVQVDDFLQGEPIQYRECQGNESSTFLGYFKTGLLYMKGGVASGLQHVMTNEVSVTRLLWVKGRHTVRTAEVLLDWGSFNRGDSFILDLGAKIIQWSGCESNPFERMKATLVARGIRDNERCGRADLDLVVEGEEPEIMLELLGEKPDLPGAPTDDTVSDVLHRKEAQLYKVSNASGDLQVTLVAESCPFSQDDLHSDECFIVDNGTCGTVYIWKGRCANAEERSGVLNISESVLEKMNYPTSTNIQILPQYAETPLFKQFFGDWSDPDDTVGMGTAYVSSQIAKIQKIPFDVSALHESPAMAAQYGMVDKGDGPKQIWRIEGSDKVAVDPSMHGQFYGGDSYIIQYDYQHDFKRGQLIYIWQGAESSQDEVGASAVLAFKLDDELGGSAVQMRVVQGKEPGHLVSLFGGKPMVVYKGGTSREGGQSEVADTRLFQLRSNPLGQCRAVEMNPASSNLNSGDAFLLASPAGCWTWKGKNSTSAEVRGAEDLAELLKVEPTVLEEGAEEAAFWDALGGEEDYCRAPRQKNNMEAHPPRLFSCSNKTGNFKMEEVPGELTQDDLAPDDVMLLDAWFQLFLWIGNEAQEEEKTEAASAAVKYIECDPADRDPSVPILTVHQGGELPTFTGWFTGWNYER